MKTKCKEYCRGNAKGGEGSKHSSNEGSLVAGDNISMYQIYSTLCDWTDGFTSKKDTLHAFKLVQVHTKVSIPNISSVIEKSVSALFRE